MISILKKRVQKVLIPLLLVAMALTHFFMNTQIISASPATTTIINMVTSNHALLSKGWNKVWVGFGYLADDQGNYLWCLQPYRVHHNVTHNGSEWTGNIAGGVGDLDGFNGTVEAIQLSLSQQRHLEKAAMFAQMNGSQSYLKFMGLYTWELIGWEVESIDNGEWDAYQAFKADINAKIQALDRGVSFNEDTHTLKVGESITLTDTNNNLQHLDIPSELNGYLLSRSGNQLTVTATNNSVDGSLRFGPNNSFITYQGTSFIYRSPSNSQEVTLLKTQDPIFLAVTLTTIKNDTVKVLKTNELGGKEAGVVYGLYSDSGATQLLTQATTDGEGLADFGEVELALGKVYVKISPSNKKNNQPN